MKKWFEIPNLEEEKARLSVGMQAAMMKGSDEYDVTLNRAFTDILEGGSNELLRLIIYRTQEALEKRGLPWYEKRHR